MAVPLRVKPVYCSAAIAASTGITITDTPQLVTTKFQHYTNDGITYRLVINTGGLRANAASDAALGVGQKLFVWPSAIISPVFTQIKMTSLAPTGLSATGGEIGLGTVIASGANATLGAVGATSEDIMGGTTISNHVATTTLVSKKANTPGGLKAYTEVLPTNAIDCSAGTVGCFFNFATTWDQTSAENFAFQANIIITYMVLGSDFGVE